MNVFPAVTAAAVAVAASTRRRAAAATRKHRKPYATPKLKEVQNRFRDELNRRTDDHAADVRRWNIQGECLARVMGGEYRIPRDLWLLWVDRTFELDQKADQP